MDRLGFFAEHAGQVLAGGVGLPAIEQPVLSNAHPTEQPLLSQDSRRTPAPQEDAPPDFVQISSSRWCAWHDSVGGMEILSDGQEKVGTNHKNILLRNSCEIAANNCEMLRRACST